MPIFSQIIACSENGVIGFKGEIPWRLPEDLKYFKEKTQGHVLIMGRKTFESFQGKLLPQRFHIVISQSKDLPSHTERKDSPTKLTSSISEAFQFAELIAKSPWPPEIFIIGGGEIYKRTLHLTQRIYLTRIHKNFQGDTFFQGPPQNFIKTSSVPGKNENIPHTYEIYEKIANTSENQSSTS